MVDGGDVLLPKLADCCLAFGCFGIIPPEIDLGIVDGKLVMTVHGMTLPHKTLVFADEWDGPFWQGYAHKRMQEMFRAYLKELP